MSPCVVEDAPSMLAVLKVAPWAMSYRMHLVRTPRPVSYDFAEPSAGDGPGNGPS